MHLKSKDGEIFSNDQQLLVGLKGKNEVYVTTSGFQFTPIIERYLCQCQVISISPNEKLKTKLENVASNPNLLNLSSFGILD